MARLPPGLSSVALAEKEGRPYLPHLCGSVPVELAFVAAANGVLLVEPAVLAGLTAASAPTCSASP